MVTMLEIGQMYFHLQIHKTIIYMDSPQNLAVNTASWPMSGKLICVIGWEPTCGLLCLLTRMPVQTTIGVS